MPNPDVLARVKSVLQRELKLSPDDIADDMQLAGSDLDLDSLDILMLLTALEKEFGVKIPNTEVSETMFESVTSLAAAVETKVASE